MKKPFQLKPQDVLLLLKLIARPQKDKRITDLAHELGFSGSEISQGLDRLQRAALVGANKREPIRSNVWEFLVYGVPYAFPAVLGSMVRGMPTAHSAPPLAEKIVSGESDRFVWPSSDGKSRGQSVSPLYSSVPHAAERDPKLYELLALLDAVRLGKVREKKIAAEELRMRILAEETVPAKANENEKAPAEKFSPLRPASSSKKPPRVRKK